MKTIICLTGWFAAAVLTGAMVYQREHAALGERNVAIIKEMAHHQRQVTKQAMALISQCDKCTEEAVVAEHIGRNMTDTGFCHYIVELHRLHHHNQFNK